MAPPYNYNPNQYLESVFSNIFAQGLASPIIPQGRGMGSVGTGPPLAGLLGITDPGMSVALNSIMQPLLSSFVGGKYVPAQFSSGMNMYSQMRAGTVLNNQGKAMGMASKLDQRAIYEMIEGSANLLGQPMGRRERQNANDVASFAANMLPTLAQIAPDIVDKMGGVKGSATVMAQNMFRGGRYAIDPVTGRRGYSAESSAEITKGVYDRLYSGDPSAMGGMTAGRAGALFDEAQRRGMMPNSSSRGKGMKEIADQMGTTISEVSQMPDLDRKLRELDASKISDKLKGMSKAVNAMSEIFGEAGEPNAPMAQLVGAIETLTQANMQNMEPHKLERMIRNTSNVAKSAGIEMPEMFKLMGATAGLADRSGVNRVFVPGITNQAVAENQAGKNIFGGAQVFGLPNADKLLNIDQQLNVQATRDYRTQDVASIARAVETFGVEPERGSELAAVYDAIKNKDSGGEYTYAGEKKNVYDLNKREGGVNQFLAGNKVPVSVIQSLNANREANEAFISKYDINTNIGRPGQTSLVTDELSMYNGTAVQSVTRDEALMKNVSPELKEFLDLNSKEITDRTSAGLFADNLSKDDLNDLKGLTKRNLNKIVEEKGINVTEEDKKALDVLAGSIYESSDSYARNQKFEGGLPTMAYSMNKGKVREAKALQADADITSQFEEGFGGMGKSSFLQRTTDFLRGAGKETKVEDFMASALNFQPTKQIQEIFAKDFDDLQKSAEAFKGVSGEQVKSDYFRSAITINADALEKEKDPEKIKALKTEQANLKEDLVRSGLSKRGEEDDYYSGMIDKSKGTPLSKDDQASRDEFVATQTDSTAKIKELDKKVKEGVPLTEDDQARRAELVATQTDSAAKIKEIDQRATESGLEKAKREKDEFEGKHGISFKEAEKLNPLELQVKKREASLNQYKELAEKLNTRVDNSGLMVGEVSGDKAANEAVRYLEKGDDGSTRYGIELAKNFISDFSMDSAAVSKAGVEGNEAKEQAQGGILRIESYAKALGIQTGELLNGKFDEGGLPPQINIDQLKKETDEEVKGLDNLSAHRDNPERFESVINQFKQKAADLKAKPDDPNATEAQKGVKAREISRLEDLSKTTKENLSSKVTAAKKTQEQLKEEPLKALEAAFKGFKETHAAQVEHVSAVDTFIKDVGARPGVRGGLTLAQIAAPDPDELATVRSLREEKFKIKGNSVKDIEARKEIDKKIDDAMGGMDSSKFKGLEGKDYEGALALVDKYKDLNGEEKKRLQELKTLVKIPEKLTEEEEDKLHRYDIGLSGSKDDLELSKLEARKVKAEHGGELVELTGDGEKDRDLKDRLEKYKSAYDIAATHEQPGSEADKAKKEDREEILNLAGITTKNRTSQDSQLRMLYDKHKAVEGGIKYGESFVIDKNGKAEVATDAQVESGNFSYINKSNGKITQGRRSYIGTSPPKKGEYDSFKNGSSVPLTEKEEAKRKELSEKQGADRTALLAKKEKVEAALSEPQRKEYEALLARDSKKYTPEDREKLEKYAAMSDMKVEDLKGLEAWKKDSETAMKGLSPEDKTEAKRLIKLGKEIDVQQVANTAKLGGFNPKAVMALMGAAGKDGKSFFNVLMAQEKKGLMSALTELGIDKTIGGKTSLTASQQRAIGQAAKLETGSPQAAVEFFSKGALNLPGMTKKAGGPTTSLEAAILTSGKGATQVGRDLALGMEAAGRYASKDGKTAGSNVNQLAALSKLLSSEDDKGLNKDQIKLKKGMLDKGFKGAIDSKGNVDEAKLIDLFKKTEAEIEEKKALDHDKGKEGGNEVTAVFKPGTKITLDGRINMETGLMAGEGTPTSTASA